MNYRNRYARRAAFESVDETCPAIDRAINELIEAYENEREPNWNDAELKIKAKTTALRDALIAAHEERLAAEEEVESLREQLEKANERIEYLKSEVAELEKELSEAPQPHNPMNKPINDGGPAFPVPEAVLSDEDPSVRKGSWGGRDPIPFVGMSLRDWFATFAPEPPEHWLKMWREHDMRANPHGDYHKPQRRSEEELRAAYKYQYADAMLAQRAPQPQR